MDSARLLIFAALSLLLLWLCSGCVTDSAGNTRWDVDTTLRATQGALDIYDAYRGTEAKPKPSRPLRTDTLYHQGQVIPAPRIVFHTSEIDLRPLPIPEAPIVFTGALP
jgi:hypothetical protein